jgi:hypothetical protein
MNQTLIEKNSRSSLKILENQMATNESLRETAFTLQTIMIDVLQRRAVMEGLEEQAIGKVLKDDPTLTLLGADYLRSQLSDLRKFFENDGCSHRLKDLTALLPPTSPVKQKHDALFAQWESDYAEVANKYYFHREKGFTPPSGFSRGVINHFIDDLNLLLDEIVTALTEAGFDIQYIHREKNSGYFQDVKANAKKFFITL